MPQVRGLTDGLAAGGCGPDRCDLDIEFMDTKRFPGAANVASFHARLKRKLDNLRAYDTIVIGDDNALGYALAERNGLFAEKSIVFHGINDLIKAAALDADKSVTGVVEAASVQATLDLIHKLSAPDGDILVITDETPSARAVMTRFLDVPEARRKNRLKTLSLRQQTYGELTERLAGASLGDAALFVSAARDRAGERQPLALFMKQLSERSRVPIYTLWGDNLGTGVLGGKVVDPYQQGWASGHMVADIANGRPVADIRVLDESPNVYEFDWRQLRRFGIDERRLPPGSQIIYRPRGLWEEHRALIVLISVVVLSLATITFILIIHTARLRRLRNDLRTSERRFRDYSESSSDYYWEMDRNLHFSYLSERFHEATGVPPDDLIGMTREESGRPPGISDAAWAAHLKDLNDHREFRDFTHSRTRSDGRTVWLAISGKPVFTADGDFRGYRGTGRDATREMQANEKLRIETERADKANRAKSEFLASMSHDLRTPLNSILGFAEMMREKVHGSMANDRYAEYVDLIHQSGERLATLINDILDLSKIESGEHTLEHEIIDVGEELRAAKQRYAPLANVDTEVRISIDAADDGRPLMADRRALSQILDNLISNAVKYSGAKDTIIIGWSAGQHGEGHLWVSDRGRGIPPEDLDTITQPFVQGGDGDANPHVSRVEGGVGLGLHIVARLVDLHQAALTIDSVEGEGTCVTVTFPAVRLADPL